VNIVLSPAAAQAELSLQHHIKAIKALLPKFERAERDFDNYGRTIAAHIAAIKKECPKGWEDVIKEECKIGRSRAYELLAIADGRPGRDLEKKAAGMRRLRASPPRGGQAPPANAAKTDDLKHHDDAGGDHGADHQHADDRDRHDDDCGGDHGEAEHQPAPAAIESTEAAETVATGVDLAEQLFASWQAAPADVRWAVLAKILTQINTAHLLRLLPEERRLELEGRACSSLTIQLRTAREREVLRKLSRRLERKKKLAEAESDSNTDPSDAALELRSPGRSLRLQHHG